MKKRIKWIDISRGIAIFCVVIGHSLGKYFPGYFANFIFSFHMPIFFVLSGYLYHKQAPKKLFIKSFFNLLVPYLATVFIGFCVLIFSRIFPNPIFHPSKSNSIKLFLISALYASGGTVKMPMTSFVVIPIGALWFLVAMFFGTQLFNYIMRIKKYGLLIKSMIIIICSITAIISVKFFFLPFSLQPALLSQVFFLSGFLIKKYNLIQKINGIWTLIFLILWLYNSKSNLFAFEGVTANNILMAIIVGIISSFCVIKFSIFINVHGISKVNNILLFWGAGSLLMLCFHLLDLDYVQIWPFIMNRLSRVSYNTALLIGMIYRVFFASLFTYIIPKIPIVRNFYMNRDYPVKDIFNRIRN